MRESCACISVHRHSIAKGRSFGHICPEYIHTHTHTCTHACVLASLEIDVATVILPVRESSRLRSSERPCLCACISQKDPVCVYVYHHIWVLRSSQVSYLHISKTFPHTFMYVCITCMCVCIQCASMHIHAHPYRRHMLSSMNHRLSSWKNSTCELVWIYVTITYINAHTHTKLMF